MRGPASRHNAPRYLYRDCYRSRVFHRLFTQVNDTLRSRLCIAWGRRGPDLLIHTNTVGVGTLTTNYLVVICYMLMDLTIYLTFHRYGTGKLHGVMY